MPCLGALTSALPDRYPKGNLAIWHLQRGGFAASTDGAVLLGLVPSSGSEGPREGKRPKARADADAGDAGSGKAAKRTKK